MALIVALGAAAAGGALWQRARAAGSGAAGDRAPDERGNTDDDLVSARAGESDPARS